MDVGSELTAILTDGQKIGGRLTFGDIARAEMQTSSNFLQRFRDQDSITVSDLAVLAYQIVTRLGSFSGDFTSFLLQLDSFDMSDDEADAPGDAGGGSTVAPFVKEAQA